MATAKKTTEPKPALPKSIRCVQIEVQHSGYQENARFLSTSPDMGVAVNKALELHKAKYPTRTVTGLRINYTQDVFVIE